MAPGAPPSPPLRDAAPNAPFAAPTSAETTAASRHLSPTPRVATAHGTVRWADGTTVPLARIQVLPDGDPIGEWWSAADAEGCFACTLDDEVERWLLVAHQGLTADS